MNVLAKITTIAAAVGLIFQPSLAAAAESRSEPVAAPMAASAGVEFSLERLETARLASASLSLAASQQTASEAEDQPRRRGPGTTTWLIVGGVVLLVVLAAAVAGSSPTPGPREGAFD